MLLRKINSIFIKGKIFVFLHIIMLLLCIFLIVLISIDTFNNVNFFEQAKFEKWQFYICIVFLGDFFLELILSEERKHYLATHFIFFLVSIPYQAILYHYGVHMSPEVAYLVRYIPLVRGGYALAIVVGWFTYNKATGLFWTYIITLISTVYFASLVFYLFEHNVNPGVKNYTDALWWAAMDVTTVGSNIEAVTGVGRVLSVLLAALGMMMFPIFTVYVTNIITERNKQAKSLSAIFEGQAYIGDTDNADHQEAVQEKATHDTSHTPASIPAVPAGASSESASSTKNSDV